MTKMDHPYQWNCPGCGYSFYNYDGWKSQYCSECGSEMEPSGPEGYVSTEELEELVKEWREEAKLNVERGIELRDFIYRGKAIAYDNCADVLEEATEDD